MKCRTRKGMCRPRNGNRVDRKGQRRRLIQNSYALAGGVRDMRLRIDPLADKDSPRCSA
ncbi:hypothetical protein GCM10011491_08280 [Brucella endophytica]|uniref:Uncharacterized protein n=1 Tax=Brucella endophytica TaxID=1963359 RepID=A0A916WAN8_9HYPH|nr:hypothetical protein GCM10011491_08280 [Brucella endophytica]